MSSAQNFLPAPEALEIKFYSNEFKWPVPAMTEHLANAKRLINFASELRRTGALGFEGRWIANAIDRFIDGAPRGETLEAALGLVGASSETWWRAAARENQHNAIRDLAATVGGDIAAQIDLVRSCLKRYERRWHRVDHVKLAMPAAYVGTPEESLYRIFAASRVLGGVPDSEKQLRRILSHSSQSGTSGHARPIGVSLG